MSLVVTVDLAACQGYACCMMEAPMVFSLDDAGKAIVLQTEPGEDLHPVVEKAARGCPARAIVVERR